MIRTFDNGTSVPLSEIPVSDFSEFREELLAEPFEDARKRVLALWKLPDGRVACVLGNPATHKLEVFSVDGSDYRELTERLPAVHRFEREMQGVENMRPFKPLKGEAAHEVAVGPVHAGVIEPGHFRFQCMGEDVHYLEIALGYQHRGAEKLIAEAHNDARRIAIAETIAGDTSVAASIAAHAALGLPYGDETLALELERIANHVGDLGALSGDVAYLPTASFCGRIRGEYLNMTAELCGNRFGRGLVDFASVTSEKRAKIAPWFERTKKELFHALDLLFSEASAMERFEGTGKVTADVARKIGLVGMAGRASGLAVDSRRDFPLSGEKVTETLVSASPMSGDVFSRARQRYEELKVSHSLVERELARTVDSAAKLEVKPVADSLTVAVVEAWRGELVHLAVRGKSAAVEQYKVFDPSCHNWFGLAQALRGEQISNFPICNKSFNLSYCGTDR